MKRIIEPQDWPKIEEQFSLGANRNPDKILSDVLNEDVINMDDELFFKYLFSTNSGIDMAVNKFFDLLNNRNCPFLCIHGYPRNGKTTFIHYINYLFNRDAKYNKFNLIMIPYNIEGSSFLSYSEKVISFFIEELLSTPDTKTLQENFLEFVKFDEFYSNFVSSLKSQMRQHYQDDGVLTNPLVNYFITFNKDLLYDLKTKIEEYLNSIYNENFNKPSIIIQREIKAIIKNSISDENSGDLFSLLILLRIFKKRNSIYNDLGKNGQFVFVFDNLDDEFRNKDIYFLQKPQIQITGFVNNLVNNPIISPKFDKCLKETLSTKHKPKSVFSFSEQLKIVYIFRTANFLIFSNIMRHEKHLVSRTFEKHFPNCLLSRDYLAYKTINLTGDILNDRLEFCANLIKKYNLNYPNGFRFLMCLTQNLNSQIAESNFSDRKSIFSLWNGDKRAIFNSITENWDFIKDIYFTNENDIERCLNGNHYAKEYVIKGTFLYFFLDLFYQNKDLNALLRVIYSHRAFHNESKNLRRFVLNYIINQNEKKDNANCINDLDAKGLGLFDLLKDISELIDKINKNNPKPTFDFDTIKYFFADLSREKIDKFSQLFTIFKSQLTKVEKDDALSNFYNLDNELLQFQTNINDSSLNSIRIFNNDNAAFLSSYLMTHYELFSFCISHDLEKNLDTDNDHKRPLLFSLHKTSSKKNIGVVEKYAFHKIVTDVLENARISINAMVDFYIDHIFEHYPPEKFEKSNFFSILDKPKKRKDHYLPKDDDKEKVDSEDIGEFQFKLIVSRHITYLESIRQGLLLDKIGSIEKEDKTLVIKFFANSIQNYAKMYIDNYEKINVKSVYTLEKNKGSLVRAYTANKNIYNAAQKILDSEELDYSIILDGS